jgi:sugar phosphate isomerase/epimerase
MLLGICGGPEVASAAKAAGYDYIEVNVSSHLKGEAGDEEFAPFLKQIRDCGMPCMAANVFVPGHLKITGPEVDFQRLKRYIETVMARAEQVGLHAIVFGSGEARKIPEGFDRQQAYAQLLDFGCMVAPLAAQHGVSIAVEPLNRGETNVLNSVAESLQYVKDVNHPACRRYCGRRPLAGTRPHCHLRKPPRPGIGAVRFRAIYAGVETSRLR